jgi:beta-N-acetylhexosaminidase
LPLKDKTPRYFILTPWGEQARGIATVMTLEGYQNVVAANETELNDVQVREHIGDCDVFLLGTLSNIFTPVEQDGVVTDRTKDNNDNNPYPGWLRYAAGLGKNAFTSHYAHHTISLAMRGM